MYSQGPLSVPRRESTSEMYLEKCILTNGGPESEGGGRKGPSGKEKVSRGRSQEGRGEEKRVWLGREQGPSQRVGAEKAGKRVKAMQC